MKISVQSNNHDYALHTLGWKAFQDLCAEIASIVFCQITEIYRPAQDGGRDAALTARKTVGEPTTTTIQCKFSSLEGKTLRSSDINEERESIVELVSLGLADEYILMTNMSVSGGVSGEVCDKLRKWGVPRPYVLGREWINQQIRSNPRLRALVPRVYGLGDLSWIIDQRKIDQSREVLAYLGDELKVYVPTDSHRRAVRSLLDHNFVLLLGEPASGKSMIAAILAATALDHASTEKNDAQIIRVTEPKDIEVNWNPREKNRFFWVDDAFGSNQFRKDYADVWNRLLPTIRTAISAGNRFVLTSRDYIWNEARRPQNVRITDLPVLQDGTVVIDLSEMTTDERQQILYNHLKVGDQSKEWKERAIPFLKDLAANPRFLPETARRLGKKAFTRQLGVSESQLTEFVTEQKQFLIQTIEQLPLESRAAICLIFLHGGRLPSPIPEDDRLEVVNKYFGVSRLAIIDALEHLTGNFVLLVAHEGSAFWIYKHPTMADAYAAIVGMRSEMVEVYVRGAKPSTLLTEVVSGNVRKQGAAVAVPKTLSAIMAARLAELEDTPEYNGRLFVFLFAQIDDEVLEIILRSAPQLLERKAVVWRTLMDNTKLRVHARAHKYGVLPEWMRVEAVGRLREAAQEGDAAFIDDDEMFGLFTREEADDLFSMINEEVIPFLEGVVERIEESANEDDDPSTVFQDLRATLAIFEDRFSGGEGVKEAIAEGRNYIDWAIERLEERMPPSDAGHYEDIRPPSPSPVGSGRSIFDDLAE